MLTEKKKRFADYYLTHLNATKAAEEAGYECKRKGGLRVKAHSLLKDLDIKEYISDKLKAKEENLIIKQDEILQYLSGCIRGTEKEESHYVVRSGSKGNYDDEVVEKESPLKARDRIRACEIMAKIYQLMERPPEKEAKIIIKNTIPKE